MLLEPPPPIARRPRMSVRRTRRRDESELGTLVRRSGRGDHASFEAVYDQSAARCYDFALASLGDADQAARATRRAMVETWRQANRYAQQPLSAAAWMISLTSVAIADERAAL